MARQATHIRIEDWPPLEEVTLKLDRFMVLLGRNDTGKTRALQAMAQILSPEPPGEEAPRCGGWVPAPEVEQVLRSRMSLPAGPLLVIPNDEEREARVCVAGQEVPLPGDLAARLSRPMGDVVWLRVTDSDFSLGSVRSFLRAVLSRMIHQGWDAPGDPENLDEDEHYLEAREVPKGLLTSPRAWVDSALAVLGDRAFQLLPRFVGSRFEAMEVSLDLVPCEDWTGAVSLRSRDGSSTLEELSSGVRAWVNLAVVEAARELGQAELRFADEGSLKFGQRGGHEPVLYLIDEPERHLHPAAQVEAARWLMNLVESNPEVAVAVATHSPAFLDLPVGGAAVHVCTRREAVSRKRGVVVSPWSVEDVSAVHRLAGNSGFRASDVFLGGTLPVLVEGKMDRDYLRTAWRILRKCSPEADGVRIFLAGGVTQAEVIALDLLGRLYPPGTPMVLVTDNLDLDRDGAGDAVRMLQEKCADLVHLSHSRFDTWALIDESILRAVEFWRRGRTWDEVEERRRGVLDRPEVANPSRLPGKEDVLPESKGRAATEAFARALDELEHRGFKALHPSIPELIRRLVDLAGGR